MFGKFSSERNRKRGKISSPQVAIMSVVTTHPTEHNTNVTCLNEERWNTYFSVK